MDTHGWFLSQLSVSSCLSGLQGEQQSLPNEKETFEEGPPALEKSDMASIRP